MAMMDPRKFRSWMNGHISPRNSKWLSENIEEMNRLVNEMLKLIEEDGDSFAKKAEMYYQRRPVLLSHVKDFHRMYRALARRYDHATGDLAKNIITEILSQGSGNASEFGTEVASVSLPSSPLQTYKLNHNKPHWRAAGFDFFLGSGRSLDGSRKGSDESSSESGSESDHVKFGDGYENSSRLEARIAELENELREARDKLQEYKNGSREQIDHSVNMQNFHLSSTNSSLENQPELSSIFTVLEKHIEVVQADLPDCNGGIKDLKVAIVAAAKQIEIEISRRDHVIKEYKTWLGALLNKSVQDKSCLEGEPKSSVPEAKGDDEETSDEKSWQEIKTWEQEQMIKELKAIAAHCSNRLLQEKYVLEAKLSKLMISSKSNCAKLKLLEAQKSEICAESEKRIAELNQSLDALELKVDMLTSERDKLNAQSSKLAGDNRARDDYYQQIDQNLQELHLKHVRLIKEVENERKSSAELTNRVSELEDEAERQRVLIMDGAEGKREAIRQLCFSLEHYRVGYQQLRKLLQVQNGRPELMVM